MNTCLIYESTYGNTQQIVQAIAYALREGGRVQIVPVEHIPPLALEGVDLLILGCPTQSRPTQALLALLDSLPADFLSQKAIVCFDTRLDHASMATGSAAEQMVKKLRKRGAAHLLPPESFFVEAKRGPLEPGEVERAINWGRLLRKLMSGGQVVSGSTS